MSRALGFLIGFLLTGAFIACCLNDLCTCHKAAYLSHDNTHNKICGNALVDEYGVMTLGVLR